LSWAAIFAGAVAAAAATAILLGTGSGIGFAVISPSATVASSAATFAIGTAIWLIVTQWLASGIGGYLAGRLRTRWPGTHNHEVFFRDTAHGFLAWALATLITLAVLASTATNTIGASVRSSGRTVVATSGGGANRENSDLAPVAYDIDTLFRSGRAEPIPTNADARLQAGRILAFGIAAGAVPPEDSAYLAQLVVQQADVSPVEARRRVDVVVAREMDARAKVIQVADAARKAASALSIFTALSMLIGAFIASVAAAVGGHEREAHP
jgi:hypothetical protein